MKIRDFYSAAIFLLSISSVAIGQTDYVTDLSNQNNSTAAPDVNINYSFGSAKNVSGCKYDWTLTNSYNTYNGGTVTTNVNVYTVKWKNVNGNATATVKLKECTIVANNGASATYSVPIRYLGQIGNITYQGAPYNSISLNCGAQTINLGVGAAANATSYQWDISSLSGWSVLSGQGTTSVTLQTSAGSTANADAAAGLEGFVTVTATRSGAPNTSTSNQVSVLRPGLQTLSITGPSQGCNNQSSTYQLSNAYTGILSTNWTTTGPLSVAGSTPSSVNINFGGSDGVGSISAQGTDGCNRSFTRNFSVGVGSPNIGTILWDGSPNNGPVPANSGSTHYFTANASNSPSANYSVNVTNNYGDINTSLSGVNGGSGQVYVYGTRGNSSININASNNCGSRSAALIVYIPSSYRVASNPTKESVAVEFSDIESREALPDKMEIVSEKQQKVVRSIDVDEVFKKKNFTKEKAITFNITDLAPGTYYLKVYNPRLKRENQLETTRLIFE